MRRIAPFLIVFACALSAGCGYLDTDLSMSEEEWEGSIGMGGIGISGRGHGWGCGGGISRIGSRRPHSGVGRSGGSSVMNLGDMYIYGARGTVESGPSVTGEEAAVVVPPPEPVDWVGHFDDVSNERQNVLLAAWLESQLDGPDGEPADETTDEEVVDGGGASLASR